ncbi:MAG: phosphoribosylamine--glycine ligase [Gammaproteobacteria bacterium]|nr:phosphoribosylamine--glycine ligase [Gammaproteobacteria bacterium]
MKVLIIGGGGREHAIAWKVAQSPLVEQIYVAPGNAGSALEKNTQNVAIAATDIDALSKFAKTHHINLTIVGPEQPLAAGIVDRFEALNLPCFGPNQQAAQLETSKIFCKDFLREHNIPTAKYQTFTELKPALAYLQNQTYPMVIKADGLAAGKGVIIANDKKTAEKTVQDMLSATSFGDAGRKIIIEEFLAGQELSYIVMVDGQHILPLASSQDHKRRDDNDLGPNTGGMGAYSPAPLLTTKLEQHIMQAIIKPTIEGLAKKGITYRGFLYAGLMIAANGQAKLLEYNCRLGDPEAQAILMRLQTDLVELCLAAIDGQLNEIKAHWTPEAAVTVVMAAGGYPQRYRKNDIITGLDNVQSNTKVFHAGTAWQANHIITNGGRVLGVTALGDSIKTAKQLAYLGVNKINWPDCFYRHDIADKALDDIKT